MPLPGIRKILIAHDGSDGAWKALSVSIDLSKRFRAELHSVSIEEHLPQYALGLLREREAEQQESRYFQQIVEEARQAARKEGILLHPHILPGHEVETIVRFVREHNVDLLVIGFMGHSKTLGRLWGSTSQSLAQQAPCPVLVVK